MKVVISRKHFNAHIQWLLAIMNSVRNEPLPPDALSSLEQQLAALGQLDWNTTCALVASQAQRSLTVGWNEGELTFSINDDYLTEVMECYQPEQVGKVIGLALNLVGHGIKLGEDVVRRRAEVEARWS